MSYRAIAAVYGDTALSAGYVGPTVRGLRRSIYPGEGAEQPAGIRLERTEAVPAVGGVMLVAQCLYQGSPGFRSMRLSDMTVGVSANWREFRSEVTGGVYWLMCCQGTANQPEDYVATKYGWRMQPGVRIHCRTYGLPDGQTAASYLIWRFYDEETMGPRFEVIWQRAWPQAEVGQPADGPGWYVRTGTGEVLQYGAGGDQTPGTDVILRVRVVEHKLILQGWGGLSGDQVIDLPIGLVGSLDRCRVRWVVKGGMAICHMQGMEYVLSGTISETAGYDPPSFVRRGAAGTADVAGTHPPGTSSSAVVSQAGGVGFLTATLSGTTTLSPIVYAVSERRAPFVTPASVSPVELAGCVGYTVTLRRDGRGQDARLRFRGGVVPDLLTTRRGAIVTLKGAWEDGSLETLFKGRLADRNRWRREEGGLLADAEPVVSDYAAELDQKEMVALTGTWAGSTINQAVTDLAQAAGLTSVNIAADAQVLRATAQRSLRFSPSEYVLRALDTICEVASWAWWFGHDGTFNAGPKSSFGSSKGTLDDTSAVFTVAPHFLEHEESEGPEYANRAVIVTEKAGRPVLGVYAPTLGDEIDRWVVKEERDVDNPQLRARALYAKTHRRGRQVGWQTALPFGALVKPWDWVTVGTIAGLNLNPGVVLQIEQVTWTMTEAGEATADYVANVKETIG